MHTHSFKSAGCSLLSLQAVQACTYPNLRAVQACTYPSLRAAQVCSYLSLQAVQACTHSNLLAVQRVYQLYSVAKIYRLVSHQTTGSLGLSAAKTPSCL